jgi:hypothetical protein
LCGEDETLIKGDGKMNDFTIVSDFDDECPVHGGEIKGEYDFGMMDATVYTFAGCHCAMSHTENDMNDMVYHTSYNSAAGRASLRKAMNALPL